MRVPSSTGHQFSQVPRTRMPRSQFDRSCGYKTTFDGGILIPVYVDEALPGDTFQLQMTAFARLATPLKPLMDNMFLESFFFAIPYRLVWDNFAKFMGEQTDPGDPTDYVLPTIEVDPSPGSLSDYFGLAIDPSGGPYSVVSLWHRAYNLVWNEWFRDQNLQDSRVVDKDDGPDDIANYTLQRRGKRHDYFTSCLPWPQKGDSVTLPLGTAARINTDAARGVDPLSIWSTESGAYQRMQPDSVSTDLEVTITAGAEADRIYADLSTATAATINQLRQAFQVQKMLERDARGGTRYTEIVRAHFDVVSPDARLQRPEYLGGGSSPVNISAIAQTSATDIGTDVTPQGNLAAMGTASIRGHGFVKSFTEHTLLLGMVCVRADLTYQQGVDRMWWRSTREDLYWPELSHIGEQAVLRREIYCIGDGTSDTTVFGYQERYGEYRYKPSKITGLFRSQAASTLDIWHLAQDFGGGEAWDPPGPPLLNAAFIEETPPIERVLAVQTEPHFLFDSYFRIKCARPMPVFGVPGLIDHF